MELNLDIIEGYGLDKERVQPDWDDVGYEFRLPCGIKLVGFIMLNGEPCKTDSLEGLDGFIYVTTTEELDELVELDYGELLDKVKEENPDFNIEDY